MLARARAWFSEEEKDLEPVLREFSKQFMAEFDYEAEARNMARARDGVSDGRDRADEGRVAYHMALPAPPPAA